MTLKYSQNVQTIKPFKKKTTGFGRKRPIHPNRIKKPSCFFNGFRKVHLTRLAAGLRFDIGLKVMSLTSYQTASPRDIFKSYF